jgi:uncharacterized membrane protein YphA (DoxX/SURF4 family)
MRENVMGNLYGLVYRILLAGAFLLAGLAVLERLANAAGYTFMGATYGPSRLLELASVALLFVIALLLREIRDGRRTA